MGPLIIQVSRKWPTSDALQCKINYRKREENVKKNLLDLFADLAIFESGTYRVNYFEINVLNCHENYL
jgi:hypothetical protein